MAQDQSEKIDDYCNDMYGHTNWGYLDTYSKEELDAKDHDIEDNIVYWHEEVEDDEECEEQKLYDPEYITQGQLDKLNKQN